MDIHKNVRLTPYSRVELVRRVLVEGQFKTKVAASLVTASKTVNLSVWPPAQNGGVILDPQNSSQPSGSALGAGLRTAAPPPARAISLNSIREAALGGWLCEALRSVMRKPLTESTRPSVSRRRLCVAAVVCSNIAAFFWVF